KNEKVQIEDIVFKKNFPDISGEIFGIELGGPEVGRGCGGRGIISGFDVLEKLGLFKWDLDVVLMDFLGDVVCGGFATPLARSLCEEVILVVSNDRQSIFAANNICIANNHFKTVGGHTRLLGLIVNRDDGSGIAERYAEAAGINIIMKLPYNSQARDKADGFDLASQKKLRDVCVELSLNDIYVMISNSDTDVVRALYDTPDFVIDEIQAGRAINCNRGKRGKITELVITNYRTDGTKQLRLFERQPERMAFHEPA
ncbi:MAG: hypothetical protein SNJ62_12485, partial [Chloracidobacterium sp.]